MSRFRQHSSPENSEKPERRRPLREFKESPQRTRPKKRLGVKAYSLLSVIVILLVIAAGTYALLNFYGQDEVAADNTERATFSSYSNEMEVPELLEAHLNALGGRQALDEVRSVRYEGQVSFSSGQNDFQMLVLQPDKGMLVTNPGADGGQKLMLNGDIAWRVIERRDGAREVLRLEQESTESLKWSLRVHNTFRRLALESRYTGLSVRMTEYLDKPCYEVTKTMPDGSDFLAVLEKETLYLLKMEETLSGGGEQNKFTILYDDHRMVSGVVEPYQTMLYKNGELDNEVEVHSIRINSGVISSLFQVPDELLD